MLLPKRKGLPSPPRWTYGIVAVAVALSAGWILAGSYDGLPALPSSKVDGPPPPGVPANQKVTATEFNSVVTGVNDLRSALTGATPSEGPAINAAGHVDVTSCGMVGDGSTDNTATIASCEAAAAASPSHTLYFPNGTYVVTQWTPTHAGLTIQGESVQNTIITGKGSHAYTVVLSSNSSITFRNIAFTPGTNAASFQQQYFGLPNTLNVTYINCSVDFVPVDYTKIGLIADVPYEAGSGLNRSGYIYAIESQLDVVEGGLYINQGGTRLITDGGGVLGGQQIIMMDPGAGCPMCITYTDNTGSSYPLVSLEVVRTSLLDGGQASPAWNKSYGISSNIPSLVGDQPGALWLGANWGYGGSAGEITTSYEGYVYTITPAPAGQVVDGGISGGMRVTVDNCDPARNGGTSCAGYASRWVVMDGNRDRIVFNEKTIIDGGISYGDFTVNGDAGIALNLTVSNNAKIGGTISSYDGLTTAGIGVPVLVAAGKNTGSHTNGDVVVSYTPPASAGVYEVGGFFHTTSYSSGAAQMEVTYHRDNGGTAVSENLFGQRYNTGTVVSSTNQSDDHIEIFSFTIAVDSSGTAIQLLNNQSGTNTADYYGWIKRIF